MAICPRSRHLLVGTDGSGVSFFSQEGDPREDRNLVPATGTSIGKQIGIAIGLDGTIVLSSTEGLQAFKITGESTGIVFADSTSRWSSDVGVSPDGCIVIPVKDPTYPRLPRISVYSSTGHVLQYIGSDGDSSVREVDALSSLTVDAKGTVWFTRGSSSNTDHPRCTIHTLEVREFWTILG